MVVSVGLVALSVGLSYLAGRLLQPKNNALIQDDKPTTLATRGSYLPRVIGRRRVGPIFAWAGDRYTTKESGGKKGSVLGGNETEIYRESGWHLLAVGPGRALHSIEQNGKAIFVGPITPTSHPSGTTIDIGNEGSFRIFWGEVDQPVNTFLGDAARNPEIGVSSRWPYTMYIEWVGKRLTSQPVWPLLTYDIEIEPQGSFLSDTEAYMAPTYTLDGDSFPVGSVSVGAEGYGKIVVDGDQTTSFNNLSGKFRLTGNSGVPDQDFDIYKVELRTVVSGTPPFAIVYTQYTDIFPDGGVSASVTADGNVQAYTVAADDGYNPAHILADLWFSKWPHGIARDQTKFDMQSLEDLGTLAVTEDLKCSVIAKDGQSMRTMMAAFMQDLGCLLPLNFRTGQLQFVPVREPSGTLVDLGSNVQIKVPEVEVQHGTRPRDRLVFSFTDRDG